MSSVTTGDDPRDASAETKMSFPQKWTTDNLGKPIGLLCETLADPSSRRCIERIWYACSDVLCGHGSNIRWRHLVLFMSGLVMVTRNRYVPVLLPRVNLTRPTPFFPRPLGTLRGPISS